jgi:AcrR family transcriptional regulator
MVDPPRLSPRERLIEAATRLFCRFGVNSVGVDAIVEAAGNRQDDSL